MKILKLSSTLLISTALLFSACAPDPSEKVEKATVNAPAPEKENIALSSQQQAKASSETDGTYSIKEGSTIGFTGSKITGSHSGGFKKFTGTLILKDGVFVEGSNKITIDMHSTWADHPKLEQHLKAPDFFDVEKFPLSIFTLHSASNREGNLWDITGELDFHGVKKSITFPVEASQESPHHATINAEFAIDRTDWDVKYPGKPDDLIRAGVVIKLHLIVEKEGE